MGPRQRDSFHTVSKERVCPKCHRKGTIEFWGKVPRQRDLAGNAKEDHVKLERPQCNHCYATFPRGTKFEMVR